MVGQIFKKQMNKNKQLIFMFKIATARQLQMIQRIKNKTKTVYMTNECTKSYESYNYQMIRKINQQIVSSSKMQMHLKFINDPNFNKNCENSKFDSNILDVTSTMYLLQKNYE